ncbi:TraM recognition site of TraD and TraG [Novosphingobium sp. B1]|nr:TraM recognition site of TraD and TraG [Novosphingobium sp. B1]
MRHDLLDTKLLQLTANDAFTLRDACQGILVTGGIGSGKTSGSGDTLAGAFLQMGMGGLVMAAKPEESEHWRALCQRHGRLDSLLEIDASGFHGYNFMIAELLRQGIGGLNAVVEIIMQVLEIARLASASPGRGSEQFWQDTTRQVLRHTVPVLYAAFGRATIEMILQFVRSAPQAPEQMRDPDWQRGSFFCESFARAAGQMDDTTGARMVSYWQHDFSQLDPKTRGNIVISLTTTLDRFNHGWLASMFCGQTSFVPELSMHGTILLLNLPALTLNEDGIIAQQLIKYLWQRAILARNGLSPDQQERPVFLWADEAQYFINSFDAEYLSTCRGSRACTVFLTQSLPTLYARMGGENAHDRVHHLVGNFATRIWHSNACAETNEWAAKTIGRSLQTRANYSEGHGSNSNYGMNMGDGTSWGQNWGSSHGSSTSKQGSSYNSTYSSGGSVGGNDSRGRNRGYGDSSNVSQGFSEQMDWALEPGAFGRILKTGGPANGKRVSAVWYQSGRRFAASGSNALLVEFAQ